MSMREREEIQKVLRGMKPDEPQLSKNGLLKISGIQTAVTRDRETNIKHVMKFTRVALEKGARIICFAELFTQPWFYGKDIQEQYSRAEPVPGPSTEPFLHLSKKNGAVLLCPVFEKKNNRFFNAVAVLEDGEIKGIYRKIHLPDTAFWEERKVFHSGDDLPVFRTKYGKIGLLIGWDVFFPEAARVLALKGAEIIFAPTAAALESHARWQSVLTAHAVCNNIYVFRVNRAGKEGDLKFYGKSFCVDPFGEMVVKPVFDRESVIIAEINLDVIPLARSEFPFFAERRIDLYGRLVSD